MDAMELMDFTPEQQKLADEYLDNNMYELDKVIAKLIHRKNVPQMYHDDLHDAATWTFFESIKSYDESKGCTFKAYLVRCIWKSFYDWTRDNFYRAKRCNLQMDKDGKIMKDENGKPIIVQNISLDEELEDDIGWDEKLASGFNMEEELSEQMRLSSDERVDEFLGKLRKTQRNILQMLMQGCSAAEIKEKLKISDKKYYEQYRELTSFENIVTIRRLFPKAGKYIEKEKTVKRNEEGTKMVTTQTAEKSKPMQYSIASVNKKIENRTIRFDHPLQRESDQWSPSMKGNLVSDILQGNPLPEIVFAEQIINGIPVVWDLDGKQRCTNCYSFANDGFKISKNIRRWNIQYLAQVKDKNGKPALDENGFPISEYREIDIRNKKFSQLPEELQEKFLDYTFKCDQYLNCDSEEIAYHIIRYNEGKSMSKPQKGIIRIGEEFATMVKSISAMPFFREKGAYKMAEAKNGTLERVVIESVMASKYLGDWNKQQEIICEYLKDNAAPEDFEDFEDMVNRLDAVVTDEVADMFDAKDSFLWFSLFARFTDTGKADKKFIEFMTEFSRSLHSKVVDGTTYDELCIDKITGNPRSTKDKYIVVSKMKLLVKLMYTFLGIDRFR